MILALKILTPILFIGAIVGLTYMLAVSTKKDADRWLVDRRVIQRRKQDNGASVELAERREVERRQPEQPAARM